MHPAQKKSCLRKRPKTNYCKVQFIEETDEINTHGSFLSTPPDSPVGGDLPLEPPQMTMMYEHLYKKEKKRSQLLETQIQHLQMKLMDRDQRLEWKDDEDIKYAKVSHLVNHISSLSSYFKPSRINHSPTRKECTSSLESISEHLQQVLFDLMVAQQQQTRYSDDLFDTEHPQGIYD